MQKKDYGIVDFAKDLGKTKLSSAAIDLIIKFEKAQFRIVDANSISEIKNLIITLKRREAIFGYLSIILFIIDILLSYLLVQNIIVW